MFSAVTVNGAEVVPDSRLPKSTDAGDSVTMPGGAPVPLRLTVSDPPLILPWMVRVPLRVPVAVGENETWMVQLAPVLMAVPTQLSLSEKSPLAEMFVGRRAMPPVLVTVTVCALLMVLCGC